MIFRSTFGATYVCFKTLYSLIETENMILNENSLLKTIKQTNTIKFSARNKLAAGTSMFLDSEPEVTTR